MVGPLSSPHCHFQRCLRLAGPKPLSDSVMPVKLPLSFPHNWFSKPASTCPFWGWLPKCCCCNILSHSPHPYGLMLKEPNKPICVFNSFRRQKIKIHLFNLISFPGSYCYFCSLLLQPLYDLSRHHCSAGHAAACRLLGLVPGCSFMTYSITLRSEWTFYKANIIISPPSFTQFFDSLFLLTVRPDII